MNEAKFLEYLQSEHHDKICKTCKWNNEHHGINSLCEGVFCGETYTNFIEDEDNEEFLNDVINSFEKINKSFDNLLQIFKKEPQFELKQEFGKLLMININDFNEDQMRRYVELNNILIYEKK